MSIFSPFQRKSQTNTRIHIEDPDAAGKLAVLFHEKLVCQDLCPDRAKVLVCIGTDRSTGDSLGPLVGTKLQEARHNYFKVLGTLDNPVHASNLAEYLNIIDQMENPFVIAIDACLSNIDNVGYINLGEGALKPGAGVNKHLPPVGNLHITGIVNVGGFMEYFVLQNTRLNIVMKMANIISQGIDQGCQIITTGQHYRQI